MSRELDRADRADREMVDVIRAFLPYFTEANGELFARVAAGTSMSLHGTVTQAVKSGETASHPWDDGRRVAMLNVCRRLRAAIGDSDRHCWRDLPSGNITSAWGRLLAVIARVEKLLPEVRDD